MNKIFQSQNFKNFFPCLSIRIFMVSTFLQFFFNFFFQEYFTFSKNGQKKCPKMKITKKSWNLKKINFSLSYFKNI